MDDDSLLRNYINCKMAAASRNDAKQIFDPAIWLQISTSLLKSRRPLRTAKTQTNLFVEERDVGFVKGGFLDGYSIMCM